MLTAEFPVEVWLGDVKKGQTPLTLPLPIGAQTITVKSGEYSINRRITIQVAADKTTRKHLTFDSIDP